MSDPSDTVRGSPRSQAISRRAFHRSCASMLALATMPAGLRGQLQQRASTTRKTRVVLLLSGVINDGGWGELAYQGIERLSADPKFKTAYAENVSLAQVQQVVRGYSDDGFDLIVGHGFEFSSALLDIAPDYPQQHYFVTGFPPQPHFPTNLMFVDLGYFAAAYGAGALAALISERKQAVGFVGGGDDPTQNRMKAAFIAGAERTVSGIRGLSIITGDYDNASKGREAAATLIGNGADVLWHAADVTGLGVIQGAVAGRAKMLGCYSDQTSFAPANMATSFSLNLSGMIVSVSESVANHSFAGGVQWKPSVDKMWPLKAGVHGEYNPALVSAQAWQSFQRIWAALAARTIDLASLVS